MPAVFRTPRAKQQSAALRGPHAKTLEQFLDDLQHRGCAALGYRLTGTKPVDRLCVTHLKGTLRVVVAFESSDVAWVLLVGPHDDRDPGIDVYTELWDLLGVDVPAGKRTKPSCCSEDGEAPFLDDPAVLDIVDAAIARRR